MRRYQLFEFCDQPWLTGIWREGLIDCLNNIHRFLQPYRHITPVLQDWARRNNVELLLDIGSGGGEQIATLLNQKGMLSNKKLKFVLSDLYPQVANYVHLKNHYGQGIIDYLGYSVPVTDIPKKFRYLSVFSAFHHFPPHVAADILNEVAKNRDGICIIEFTERNWISLFSMIPAFLFNLLAPITASKFRLSKLLFGTFVPVIPLIVCFDGMISVLRSYKADELLSMLPDRVKNEFAVEHGSVPWGYVPGVRANYFFLARTPAIENEVKAKSPPVL